MNGKLYSDSEKDYIMSLILLGNSNETIAKMTGRTVNAIEKFRNKYNWIRKEWRFRMRRMILVPEEQYCKILETYDQVIEELIALKEQLEILKSSERTVKSESRLMKLEKEK